MSKIAVRTKELGKATEFLRKQDYEILGRNYRNRVGEIDLVAQKDRVMMFLEVRTRQSDNEEPWERVNDINWEQLKKVSQLWCEEYNYVGKLELSVIELVTTAEGEVIKIEQWSR